MSRERRWEGEEGMGLRYEIGDGERRSQREFGVGDRMWG